MRYPLIFALLWVSLLFSSHPAPKQIQALYHSLDPHSVSKHLAFYHLYPDTDQGIKARHRAYELLTAHHPNPPQAPFEFPLPDLSIDRLVNLVNKEPFDAGPALSDSELDFIDRLANFLPNRHLPGHHLQEKEAIAKLPSNEIDLARALLVYEGVTPIEIKRYEASLDLMALQILATLPKDATARQKVDAISHFIFFEQGFRFPPHSLYAEDIDLYTFLPAVLDSRQGVCLGVSILYLCLAQRLDLNLEIITPPGHIFIRLEEDQLNIETTARGIHLPDETYLGVNTRHLQRRTLKEVVGLAFINQASVIWQKGDHNEVVRLYEVARIFLPHDPLLQMFYAYNLLFTGANEKGKALLKEIVSEPFNYAVTAESAPEDYLQGRVDLEGLKVLFERVDETRDSILAKQKKLQKILRKHPKFRDGWLHLAVTYLQLSRAKEARESLLGYHVLSDTSATVEYYLAQIALQRMDYRAAQSHLNQATRLTKSRSHNPKALKHLKRALHQVYPN